MAKLTHLLLASVIGLAGCATSPATISPMSANTSALARRNLPAKTINVAVKSGSAKRWAQGKGLTVLQEFPQLGAAVIAAPNGAESLLAKLQKDPALKFAEADQAVTMARPKRGRSPLSIMAADPQEAKQYSLDIMQVKDAWKHSRGKGVTVAVIDSGFDYDHPELKNQLLPGANPYYGVVGKLFSGPSGGEHGTHVAGIIAAQSGNNLGISGVAPDAKIFPIKLWPDEDYEKVRAAVDPFYTQYIQELMAKDQSVTSALAGGIVLAADRNCDVINMSLGINQGGPEQLQLYYLAVDYALKKGTSVVVASGNERQEGSPTNWLAIHPGIIAVGATDAQDQIAAFSNKAKFLSVSAPGVRVLSTVPATMQNATFAYEYLDGTSMATPNVAGVIALVKAANPKLTPQIIKTLLEKTADDQGPQGWDADFGHGRVNAYKAVAVAKKL